MAKKKGKLSTPDWVLEGFESKVAYEASKGVKKKKAGKTFKVRRCPECSSDEVGVSLGDVGVWACRKCNWKGSDVKEEELSEDEFMKYLDDKGEEVA